MGYSNMLKKFYDRSALGFSIAWIIVYCMLLSAGDAISCAVGIEKSVTFPLGLLLCGVLFFFLKKYRLLQAYGLCPSAVSARSMLYYLPVLAMLSANLWYGTELRFDILETVLYICSMCCVGFLEEIIFRGLLYRAMCVENPRAAVIVSSLTFGIGHIINLFNGSGAEPAVTLLQVVYAAAAGFLFVMIFRKTGSLIGCIVIHGAFNALSVFASEPSGMGEQILSCLLLTVISGGYAAYLAYSMRKTESQG